MERTNTKNRWTVVVHLLLFAFIILLPSIITYVTSSNLNLAWESMWIATYWLAPTLVVYLLNFYVCIPMLWFRHRRWTFAIVNQVLIVACNVHLLIIDTTPLPHNYRAGYSSFVIIFILVNLMGIGIAMSIRYAMRQSEKKQREVEAELAWLKNQINPHFLFNTLNNISSLTQIDADEAQNAVMQLSDLLRYAMYETNKKLVPLKGEVEFMRNYVELMKLRCNEMTTVNFCAHIGNEHQEVAPLLFISLVENAFKHGVNSNQAASISICLTEQQGTVSFTCDNTNNPKATKDRSGSGIGLENTRRRLDLLYHSRYAWEQTVTPQNVYHVSIKLKP